eukprot:Sspe_Gene.67221::Locus_39685_Transcript_1_1_Confidence_1.000_Length_703::g.67221::m.67221/K07555/ATPeAF1, ATPAF1, ATP11; ATP synthase mitochondrial F1 complex assembly factor 1
MSGTTRFLKEAGRKSLDQIMKIDLLERTPPADIINIWKTHHEMILHYWGRVVSAAQYEVIQPRLRQNPYFVVPVFRDKGLFNVVTNYQPDLDLVLVAPLGEWQKKQDHTTTHMTIQFFPELIKAKGLVLVRCELQDQHMTKQDAMFVTHILLKYYTFPQNFSLVETFNKNPSQFDYHAFLRQLKEEAEANTGKGKNVQILDKKADWKPVTSA